jgi:hypothetical protein
LLWSEPVNRRQHIAIVVGTILVAAAIFCPPWSYYRGELRIEPSPGVDAVPVTDVEKNTSPDHPFAPTFWFKHEYTAVQVIRGLAVMILFAGTALACVAFRSRAGIPDRGSTEDKPARRAFAFFWLIITWIVVVALAVPVLLLIIYLIHLLRR